MPDDLADFAAARGNAGDGRYMISLQRVLHSDEKSQGQNREHSRHPTEPLPKPVL